MARKASKKRRSTRNGITHIGFTRTRRFPAANSTRMQRWLTWRAQQDTPFTLASLFRNGQVGGAAFVFNPNTCFQDVAATVPCTAHGDPVRAVMDQSGNGYVAVQDGADGSRPLLKQDADGFWHLETNGSSTFLRADGIDLTRSDEVTVITGYQKDTDTSARMVYEFSTAADSTSNHGTFALLAPRDNLASNARLFASGDALRTALTQTGIEVGETHVYSQLVKISADYHVLRLDGVQTQSTSDDLKGGMMGNHSLHIGSRAGTSLFGQGKTYSLLVINEVLTGAILAEAEDYTAHLSNVSL